MKDLLTDRSALPQRITDVRNRLGAMTGTNPDGIEERVAASTAHLGLTARLIAAALGGALESLPVRVDLESAWWQPDVPGPYPLSITSASVPADPLEAISALMDSSIVPITLATARHARVSRQVLWGNIASAVNSAATQIATADPARAGTATRTAHTLLSRAPLNQQPARIGRDFRRQSCCLIYRIAATRTARGAVCGDCVLPH
jgi:hypothetical protein